MIILIPAISGHASTESEGFSTFWVIRPPTVNNHITRPPGEITYDPTGQQPSLPNRILLLFESVVLSFSSTVFEITSFVVNPSTLS
jgi:hypothetical protein